MIPLLIFGGWALLVACACAIGANKHLAEVTEIGSGLRGDIRKARREKELAREKTSILLQYMDSDREYRTFDDVLRGLPKGDYHGNPHQYRIMEAKRFDLAAFHAISTLRLTRHQPSHSG